MQTTFETTILGFGNNTGIEVPDQNIAELGKSKRPPVTVQIGSYSYKSTVGIMGGKTLISLPKVHREAAGLKAGDKVMVVLVLDDGIRTVDVPPELADRLSQNKAAKDIFDNLAYSHRKEYARWISEAKKPETREKRLDKAIKMILASKK